MKKQFIVIFMLLAVTLSACSYKNEKDVGSIVGESYVSESVDIKSAHKEDDASIENRISASADEMNKISEETYTEIPAIGGGDYAFLRKYIDEVYNIHLASEIVGREACQKWVDNVLLKKSAEEQEAIPPIYQIIVDLKISKEDLIKKNNEKGGIYLSAETIEALYEEDIETMKKSLMSPLALYQDGEIYTFDDLSKKTRMVVNIPTETLDKYFDYIETVCEQNGLLKYMQESIDNARKANGLD